MTGKGHGGGVEGGDVREGVAGKGTQRRRPGPGECWGEE